ncbi:MAG: Ldh family oxidoreductase [Spirochaeta sp.]|jgi:LDH2 family malate/lactate/ureidoglycolate dehydrogenase|nr:Ldh family oxidoreductase [Spirochaeta sp.]
MKTDRYSHKELQHMAKTLLERAGQSADVAEVIADILVEADMMGHATHGLNLLPAYLEELADGGMDASGEIDVVRDNGSAVVWDGHYRSGVYLTERAITEALERSKEYPVVTYAIRRAHHIACLAAYMPRIIAAGRVGILAASDPNAQMIAPYGGKTPVYSPNPMAAAIPAGPNGPIIIDISTSVTAGGVVHSHRKLGTPLPGKWLLDGDGNATDDPNALRGDPPGTILPLGGDDAGYKGYALGLIIEALTSGLGGYGRKDNPTNWGTSVYLQIIDPDAFSGLAALETEMGVLTAACRDAEPRSGYDEVRVPGDRALVLRERSLRDGVEISELVFGRIRTLCSEAGIETPATLERDV